MMRNVIALFVASLLAVGATQAGRNLKNAKPAKLIIDNGVESAAKRGHGSFVPGLDNANSLTWIAVDSMANAFGPASTDVAPMAYDAATNVLAVIHRGAAPYAAGSGQLWYNISHDGGATWYRVPGGLNGSAPNDCRYPSGAISNPAGTNDTNQCLFVYSAPNLENAGGFGQITYGVDFPLGGGSGSGTVDPGSNIYNAATTIWTQPSSPWILWATVDLATGAPNNFTNWRTEDYVTVTRTTPPSWRDTLPNFINALGFINGKATTGGSYFGVQGLFGGDDSAFAFNGGYAKSIDNGATWGPWTRPRPDWMQATGLPTNLDLFDYYQADGPGTTVSYLSDMVVDGNNRVHFFHVIADSPWTELVPRHIVEIYETGTGWAYKWVQQNLNPYTGLGYPGATGAPPTVYLDQTHNAIHASVSSDGQLMTMVWLDAATMAPADTFPDIWFSFRKIADAAWSTPQNLTQTPGFPELLLHAAPVVKVNGGGSYTLFLGRSYQSSINTYPPDNGLATTFYVAPYTFSTSASLNVGILAGWNMISNPVTNPVPDDSAKHLYPSIISRVFRFSNGYVAGDTMGNGIGYWGKFPAATSQPITGSPRTCDSINVVAGWNMVGSISSIMDTSVIVSIPPGLRTSNWFGYAGGYVVATQIIPGKAYWVKASGVGKFAFCNPVLAGPSKNAGTNGGSLDILNSLTITDTKGRSQTLYFGADARNEIQMPLYDMPPLPPSGSFDARFETSHGGSMVQTHPAKVSGGVEFPVTIQSDAYPLTVTWNVNRGTASYELTDAAGGRVFGVRAMNGTGSMKITNPDVNSFRVKLIGDGQVPKEFALEQNYPNPFNPSTSIKYDLPVDARVSLKVFNIIGQEVATLVNEEQIAGYKSVVWDASNVASGVYFYRLQAGDFASSKKLLLLK